VGAPYNSTHVNVNPLDLAAFVNRFIATFGGQASKLSLNKNSPTEGDTMKRT